MKIFVVLAGLLLIGACVRSIPPVNQFTFCNDKEDGDYCASCLQPVYCNATGTPPATVLPTCNTGHVCKDFTSALASCVNASESTKCVCGSTSTFCDPFNEDYLVTCDSLTAIVTDVTLCEGSVQKVCRANTCVARPSCSGIANGTWVRYYPVCNMGYQCVLEEVSTEIICEDNQYLSDDGICLTGLPVPCSNNCLGNCPDETDCTQFYYCNGAGTALAGPEPCPENAFFNPHGSPPQCVANDSSVCAPLTACDF